MNRFLPIFGAVIYAWPMLLQFSGDAADSGSAYRPVHLLLDQPDDGAFPLQEAPATPSFAVYASGNVSSGNVYLAGDHLDLFTNPPR